MGTVSGNKTLVDVAAQTLTAVKVSKDSSANATGNRIWVTSNTDQINGNTIASDAGASGTGTQRVVLANDKYVAVSKDWSANATGNRIYVASNTDQIGGTAIDANSGNKSAGSQRVVIATDDVNISAIAATVGTEASAAPAKSIMMGVDDGTNARNAKGGADGAVYVNQNNLLPGEDAVNDERAVKIKTLGTGTGSVLAAAINTVGGGTVGDPILTSTEVLGYSRVCLEFKNAGGGGGNDIDRLLLFGSVSGSNWDAIYDSGVDLAWSTSDGGFTVLIESNGYRYIKTEGLTAAGSTTVDCYYCGNKG